MIKVISSKTRQKGQGYGGFELRYLKLNKEGMEEILLEYYHFDYVKKANFETVEVDLRQENGEWVLYVKAYLHADLQENTDHRDFPETDFNRTSKLMTEDGNFFYGKFCEKQIKKLFRGKYYFEKFPGVKRVFLLGQKDELCLVCLKGFGRRPENFEALAFTDTYRKI